jgi:hypothetical protein
VEWRITDYMLILVKMGGPQGKESSLCKLMSRIGTEWRGGMGQKMWAKLIGDDKKLIGIGMNECMDGVESKEISSMSWL